MKMFLNTRLGPVFFGTPSGKLDRRIITRHYCNALAASRINLYLARSTVGCSLKLDDILWLEGFELTAGDVRGAAQLSPQVACYIGQNPSSTWT
jgi:hypothetical protein